MRPTEAARRVLRRWRLLAMPLVLLLVMMLVPCTHAAEAVHLLQAETWSSPSGDWAPPPSLHASGDAVLDAATPWAAVALPHARPRSTASSAEQASAPPEVQWYRLRVPANALPHGTPQGMRLYIPRWQTVGTVAVYANGRLAWQTRGSRVWNGFNRPVWLGLEGPDQVARGSSLLAVLPVVGGAHAGDAVLSGGRGRPGRARRLVLLAHAGGVTGLLGVFLLAAAADAGLAQAPAGTGADGLLLAGGGCSAAVVGAQARGDASAAAPGAVPAGGGGAVCGGARRVDSPHGGQRSTVRRRGAVVSDGVP